MTEDYLQILEECMKKKIEVLDRIIELDGKQFEISSHQPMDFEAYDQTMEEKGELIEEILRLDEGFTSTFERVKEELLSQKEKYAQEIHSLQELIQVAVDKSVTIETQEQRNKTSMEAGLKMKRNEIKQLKKSTSVALNYYKSMSRINDVDPQLMDHHH